MNNLWKLLLLTSLALCATSTIADAGDAEKSLEAVSASVQESIRAKQVTRSAPKYPRRELNRGREAWVHVTYCVDETGSVKNVSVLDSIGSDAFGDAAVATVQQWEFEPALQDGKPAWQSRNEVYINFALAPGKLGASSKFVRQFRKIGKLIEKENVDAAEVTALRPAIDQLESMIDGDKILQIPAEIRARGECTFCDDSWDFIPVRNDFKFVDVQGSLNSIDMRCDHKRFESIVSDEVEWHIPEKWGMCHIQVYGEPGTTFDVLMLPADNS